MLPKRTWRSYELHVRRNLIPNPGRVALEDLTPVLIDNTLRHLRTRLSPRSVSLARTTLSLALTEAKKLRIIHENVAAEVGGGKKRRCKADILNIEQAQQFLQAVQGHRDESILLVNITAGPRQGETLAATWPDLDFDAGTLHLHSTLAWEEGGATIEENKTPSANRRIRLLPFVLGSLRRHKAAQDAERAKRLAEDETWHETTSSGAVGMGDRSAVRLSSGDGRPCWNALAFR